MSNSFAQDHLQKYGWQEGKGLGLNESGITDPIKPKLKFDTAGIGHDAGEQFSFHWWDHVFNKAAKNIHVENSEEGVEVKQKEGKSNLISNKKSAHQSAKQKPLLYGSFVKHGTLKPDGRITQDRAASSSSSEDSDDEDCPPETYEGNDEKLFKACGGRTAHKGARHGLLLSGKLRRIEEQENLLSSQMKLNTGASMTRTGYLGRNTKDDGKKRKKKNKKIKRTMKRKTPL